MSCVNIMSSPVATVCRDDLLTTASQVMLWSGGRHLPVVDGDDVIGILSDGDLFRARAQSDVLVREAMTSPVKTITTTASVVTAANLMAEAKIGCLPVMDRGKLVGIVTTTDVLNAFDDETVARQRTALENELGVEVLSVGGLRDRIRVKLHLGGMDLRDAFRDLQSDFVRVERAIADKAANAVKAVHNVRGRFGKLVASVRDAPRE